MFETMFKALGEPTRLKILKLLAVKDLCVCDLEEIMQASQPRISQHLKVLKQARLVNERREGQRRVCSLNRSLLNHNINEFLNYLEEPLENNPDLSEELFRLQCLDGQSCLRKYGKAEHKQNTK
ncbi:MAG: winged helix-turn-helix transcriptional regulator [Syntrophomonadaceae bacterium]|nr:winged helix-turn-helix transcriptional regulator [Syntrophomonadaceae bacterium]